MRLSYRQRRQLCQIDVAVRRAAPHLGAMFGIFGRLCPGQDLPDAEQLPDEPSSQGRLSQPPGREPVHRQPTGLANQQSAISKS